MKIIFLESKNNYIEATFSVCDWNEGRKQIVWQNSEASKKKKEKCVLFLLKHVAEFSMILFQYWILFYKGLQKYILEKDSDHQLINFPDKISWKVILTLKIVEFNKFTSKKNYNFKKIEKFNKIFFL
jgi:hypothetical protein